MEGRIVSVMSSWPVHPVCYTVNSIDRVNLPHGSELRTVAVAVWPEDSSWEGLSFVFAGPVLAAVLDAQETGAPLETDIGRIRVTELMLADWPEGVDHVPYRCCFIGEGPPRGELARLLMRDGTNTPGS